MYSVVLAAMLTTGTATPAWGGKGWYNYGCGGCFGCVGCRGCYGCGGCYGCYGCGGCYGCAGGCFGCYGGCYGCYGCYGCFGTVMAQPVVVQPVTRPTPPVRRPEPVPAPKKATGAPAPAQVIVQLPAQAELFIDGQRSRLTATTRTVVTPELEQGEDYYYTLRAEVIRNGKAVQKDQRVLLRAGEVSRVDFRDLAPPAAVADRVAR